MVSRTLTSSRLVPVTALEPEAFAQFGQVIQNPATHNASPALEKVVANQGSATKWLDVTSMDNHYHMSSSRKAAKVVMNMFVCQPRKLRERTEKQVFNVQILERHPFTPQTFVPLGLGAQDKSTYYLVIVAPTLPLSQGRNHQLEPPYPTLPPRRKRSLLDRLRGARPIPFANDFSTPTTSSTSGQPSGPRPKGSGPPDLANIQAFIARGDQAVTYGPGTWHAPMVVLGEKAIDFVVVQYSNGVGLEDCQEMEIEVEDGGDGLAVDVGRGIALEGSPRAKL